MTFDGVFEQAAAIEAFGGVIDFSIGCDEVANGRFIGFKENEKMLLYPILTLSRVRD